jgi:hypothetical protein
MPPTDRYLPMPTFLPCIPVKTEPSLKGTINTGVKRLFYARKGNDRWDVRWEEKERWMFRRK